LRNESKDPLRKPGLLLYDYLIVKGGAERVAIELARGIDDTTLCTALVDREVFSAEDLSTIELVDLSVRANGVAGRIVKSMRAFTTRTAFARDFAWALYTGNYAPAAVRQRPCGANLYYCHNLPRFVYDLRGYYLERLPAWQRPGLRALIRYVQPRYERAVAAMDRVLVNSRNVQARLRKFLGVESTVVHPFCDRQGFRWISQGDYYLSTARLEPYKRVDRIVEAFVRMPERRLIVTSGGSELARLQQMASGAPNIEFTGWLGEGALRKLIGNAIASLYVPLDEDFGMSPLESMAAGKPVVGVAEGGLLETMIPGETGILLEPDFAVDAVRAAVRALSPQRALAMRAVCERRAADFGKEVFLDKIRSAIQSVA